MSESGQGVGRVHIDGEVPSGPESLFAIVVRVAGGDEQALAELYDLTSRYVYIVANRILNRPEEAEEVTLAVYQQVWRLAGSFDPTRCQAQAWLGMMARSRALDRWRSMRARARLDGGVDAAELDVADGGDTPERAAGRLEDRRRLEGAMEGLTEEQRKMVRLAFFEGLSHIEIANRERLPLGTVKTRIRLSLQKMREVLEHAGA